MKKKKLASAYKLTMQIKSLLTILFLLCVLHRVFFFLHVAKLKSYCITSWYGIKIPLSSTSSSSLLNNIHEISTMA